MEKKKKKLIKFATVVTTFNINDLNSCSVVSYFNNNNNNKYNNKMTKREVIGFI
jgi:hypothetical protein